MISGQNLKDSRELQLDEKTRTLNDILMNFNFEDIKTIFSKKKNNKRPYEWIYRIDLSSFNNNLDWEMSHEY